MSKSIGRWGGPSNAHAERYDGCMQVRCTEWGSKRAGRSRRRFAFAHSSGAAVTRCRWAIRPDEAGPGARVQRGDARRTCAGDAVCVRGACCLMARACAGCLLRRGLLVPGGALPAAALLRACTGRAMQRHRRLLPGRLLPRCQVSAATCAAPSAGVRLGPTIDGGRSRACGRDKTAPTELSLGARQRQRPAMVSSAPPAKAQRRCALSGGRGSSAPAAGPRCG